MSASVSASFNASSMAQDCNPSIRIVCLPVELQTTHDVARFVDHHLGAGGVCGVYITNNKAANGAEFRSAVVHMDSWYTGINPLKSALLQSADKGVCVPASNKETSFHFANGSPMSHVKILLGHNTMAKLPPYSAALELGDSDWRSIYIPVVPEDLAIEGAEVDLTYLFENHLKVGRITRIDYVTRKLAESDKEIRSAYVHFQYWCDNLDVGRIRKFMNESGEFHCRGFYNGFEFIRFDTRRFLAFKINHTPIPDADGSLNIHQLNAIKIGLEKENTDLRSEMEAMHEENIRLVNLLQGTGKINTIEDGEV